MGMRFMNLLRRVEVQGHTQISRDVHPRQGCSKEDVLLFFTWCRLARCYWEGNIPDWS